ncbi:MAG: hypothetical protein J6N52_01375 [Clostridia bacterium]|nr:hypothetical protein [Clostridia bacterium]
MTMPQTGRSSVKKSGISEEERLCSVLSDIKGAGKVSVMITYYESERSKEDTKKAKGAVVTADGADNPNIKNALSEAVQAALDLPPHKVRVYKKSG